MTNQEPKRERPPSRPGWWLDELTSAGRENLDAGHVARYDAKEDASADAEIAVLESLGLTSDSDLVEMGAGTGQFTLAAAPRCARVVAVDVSPIMLARLRAKLQTSDPGNVEVVQAGFLTYEHRGPAADFVYSRYALHHLPDFWKALALQRITHILRPGGILRLWDVVYGFDPGEAEAHLEAWCETAGGDEESGWSRAEYEEHIRDEHSTFTWLLEPMMERAGFQIMEADRSPDGIFARYVARRV